MRLIPGIPYAAPPRTQAEGGPLAWPPKLIVVHCTRSRGESVATAAQEASYAATRTDEQSHWTSAHAYIDGHGALGSLPLDYRAWSAYSWANAAGIHVEMCGAEGQVPDAVQRAAAALVRQLCLMTGIPMRHLDGAAIRQLHDSGGAGGVTGHQDITAADIDGNDHTDPGFSSAEWARFMAWVTEGDDMAPFLDDPNASALAYRLDAITFGLDQVRGGPAKGESMWLVTQLKTIAAALAASAARETALAAAVTALASSVNAAGGSVDAAAVIAHVDQVAAAEVAREQAHEAEKADLRAKLAAALAGTGV
jgi:hypothetical protein